MKRYLIGFGFVFILAIFCIYGCFSPKGPSLIKEPAIQKPTGSAQVEAETAAKKLPPKGPLALDFKLPDLKQNMVTLSAYKNKQPVILFFWAIWCPSCWQESKELNGKYKALADEGIQILAINVGDSHNRVDNFAKEQKLGFNILLDEDTAVTQAYGILGVPTFILIDKKGYVVFTNHYFPQGKYKELILQ